MFMSQNNVAATSFYLFTCGISNAEQSAYQHLLNVKLPAGFCVY